MKEVTKELIEQIDQNNLKGLELLRSIDQLEDNEAVALDVLVDCAIDYLEKNLKLINDIL